MIIQVEAYNYKCLKVVRQPLGRFHVLIGRNGSGKSTFLDTLLFLRDALTLDIETAVFGIDADIDWFVLRTQKDSRDLLHKGVGKSFTLAIVATLPQSVRENPKLSHYDRCRYQVRVGVDETGEMTVLEEQMWLIEERASHEFEGLGERESLDALQDTLWQSRRRKVETPSGWKRAILRREGRRAHFWSEVSRWNFPQPISPIRLALSFVDEDRFPASSWLKELLSNVYSLQLNPRRMREPCPATAGDAFALDGSNMPKVVKHLREKEPKWFQRWLEHVRLVLKGLKDVEVRQREEDNALYLVLRYEGFEVKQWCISEGTLRFLALTLLGYLPEEEGVWLIEEPENGIHPQALEAVIGALPTAEYRQFLIATHSPIIVDCKDYITPYNLLCFQLENGATKISTAAELMVRRDRELRTPLTLGDLMAWGVL